MLRRLAILGTCVGALAITSTITSACKKSAGEGNADIDNADNQAFGNSFDDSEPAKGQGEPMTGVDLTGVDEVGKKRFEALADKLASPCGKAHSLRTSKNTDASCIRAPFAVRFVAQMIRDSLSDKEIAKWYGKAYAAGITQQAFKLAADTPRTGPDDAPVTLVEFYDYGCPACKAFAPELDAAVKAFPSDAALYYKQFPLSSHPDSGPAAQAALAAAAQGKFAEMHQLLFQNSPRHKWPALEGYAKSLGLDMVKFAADYKAAAPRVTEEKNEGVSAKVAYTPTLFVNGKPYEGPQVADYLKIFIEEAIALKR